MTGFGKGRPSRYQGRKVPPAEKAGERLEGVVESVRYMDHRSGFAIARVRAAGRDPFHVKGALGHIHPGQSLAMWGRWVEHGDYGLQFSVSRCEPAAPVTIEGIAKFLSGFVKGIGPAMAERIVRRFGMDAMDIVEKNPERLCEVEGIGPRRAAQLKEAWDSRKEVRDVMLFLRSHGVNTGHAWKIWRFYGADAVKLLSANPYRLSMDISGIGFQTADDIAGRLGVAEDSPARLQAGIIHVMESTSDDGHSCFPLGRLLDLCSAKLGVNKEVVSDSVERLSKGGYLVVESGPGGSHGSNGKFVFLKRFYEAEKDVALRLKSLIGSGRSFGGIDVEKAVERVRMGLLIAPAAGQIEALHCALENKVAVVTGGPGTGKTTLIRGLMEVFRRDRAEVALAAPTGRAAKRMSEATGHEAKTIHRLLEYNPGIGGFQRSRRRPLDCDVVIIDEASMVDLLLMARLLCAVKQDARLILVGDVNQLPSVGAGNVLSDIIASKTVPVVSLTEVFRQASRSDIIVNAHRINQGVMPVWGADRGEGTDFYFIAQSDPSEVLRIIKELVGTRIPRRFGLDPVDDIQVLSPMHRGIAGTANLNIELQKMLNPSEGGLMRGELRFSPGDKVMQVRNDYERDVYNGDIGRIESMDARTRRCTVRFDDRSVGYDFSDMDRLALAYAVSVHKSQGSEYPAVVLPLLDQHHIMLQRNLLYTAVTRGRRLVVLVGTRRALAAAVGNDRIRKRYTMLDSRLRGRIEDLGAADG